MNSFTGVKVALLLHDQVLVTLRDNKPGLPFAGMWDLPGGGREDDESPLACAQREIQEELGLRLNEEDIIWQQDYPAMSDPNQRAYFMVAKVSSQAIDSIVFGDEGEDWKELPVEKFFTDPTVVPKLKERLQDYIDENNAT